MSMRVRIIETGEVHEYENTYALRLIEQGDAVLVSGDTPVDPEPEPYDPDEMEAAIRQLESDVTRLESWLTQLSGELTDTRAFAEMNMTTTQAEVMKLESEVEEQAAALAALAGE